MYWVLRVGGVTLTPVSAVAPFVFLVPLLPNFVFSVGLHKIHHELLVDCRYYSARLRVRSRRYKKLDRRITEKSNGELTIVELWREPQVFRAAMAFIHLSSALSVSSNL